MAHQEPTQSTLKSISGIHPTVDITAIGAALKVKSHTPRLGQLLLIQITA